MHTDDYAPAAPLSIDVTRPNAARMYDWYLGGSTNYAVDREFGKKVVRLWPHVQGVARQNRGFLRRVVINALNAGVRQFLDLGSGVPTVGNVHHIVRRHLPPDERATVVYVDYEPVATAHVRVLLEGESATGWARVVQADLRDPAAVCGHEVATTMLDWGRPVCVLMIAVLHFVGGRDAVPALLTEYGRRVTTGSWLAVSHIASDEADPVEQAAVESFRRAYDDTTNPLWVRDRPEILGWFQALAGWRLLNPGLVHLPDWRPDEPWTAGIDVLRPFAWCGAAEKVS